MKESEERWRRTSHIQLRGACAALSAWLQEGPSSRRRQASNCRFSLRHRVCPRLAHLPWYVSQWMDQPIKCSLLVATAAAWCQSGSVYEAVGTANAGSQGFSKGSANTQSFRSRNSLQVPASVSPVMSKLRTWCGVDEKVSEKEVAGARVDGQVGEDREFATSSSWPWLVGRLQTTTVPCPQCATCSPQQSRATQPTAIAATECMKDFELWCASARQLRAALPHGLVIVVERVKVSHHR
jgi:hypothetical protein